MAPERFSDTIFALSSGALPSAIAIVRVSGDRAFAVAEALAGSGIPLRAASYRALQHDGALIDHGLVLRFAGPNSVTGEDLVEFHVHGGRAVVAALLDTLESFTGLRMAEPGEFSRRAHANGKLDLTQAEGLGELLAAETELRRRQAIMALDGGLSRLVEAWQTKLVGVSAQVEASLDHADESDVAPVSIDEVRAAAKAILMAMSDALSHAPAERLFDGLRVVIAGRPNAGKSTLLNALVGREAAIATPIAGTTRDVIEVPVVLDGLPLLILDTAGLRDDPNDPVEAIGIARAEEAIARADIIVALDDSVPDAPCVIRVAPKSDLEEAVWSGPDLRVSAQTGGGLEQLRRSIVAMAKGLLPPPDRVALNVRQQSIVREALASLEAAMLQDDPLIWAEQIRIARNALDRLTGKGDTEAMLDALFNRFCIGK